ncbi:MAG TPA: HoxN/HupN/NixA family nickel/cobalt transporter, partial [Acetobacteraceae bacterium]|nr:HoxN/HupN/NixA family nickel/cobalt transporter [Acetobacteraceae bacterium]
MPLMPNPFDDGPTRTGTKVAVIFCVLLAANIVAWLWAWIAFGYGPTLLGIALLAYVLGLRHAFDADHIAAIDNVVRKLMQQGKAPYAAGFFFSLGHSTVVVLASIAIAGTATVFQSRFAALHELGGIVGTFVSALFLLVIGIANLFILRGVWAA